MTRAPSTRTALVAVLLGALGVLGLGASLPVPSAVPALAASQPDAGAPVVALVAGSGHATADVRVDDSVPAPSAGAVRPADRLGAGAAAVLPAVLVAVVLVLARLTVRRGGSPALRRALAGAAPRAPPLPVSC